MKINLLVYLQLFRHTIGQVFIYVKFFLLNVNSKEFLLIVILCSTLIMKLYLKSKLIQIISFVQ
jgi:hypothetical protein